MDAASEDDIALFATCAFTVTCAVLLVAPAVVPPKSLGAKVVAWAALVACVVIPAMEAVAVVTLGKGVLGAEYNSTSVEAYWGRGTAWWHGRRGNHDFCEENYRYSPYIVEFHNTWSSAPIVFLGSAGTFYTRRYASLDKRYSCAFCALGSIGFGSVLFHGTLLQWGQALDESPMMLLLTAFLFLFIEDGAERRFGAWLPILLCCSCAAFMGSYLFLNIYWMFVVGFTLGVLVLSALAWKRVKVADRLCWLLFLYGLAGVVGGFIIWNIDNHLCSHVWFLRLHIGWHFGAGMGGYLLLLASLTWRYHRLGKNVALVLPSFSGMLSLDRAGHSRGTQLSLSKSGVFQWTPAPFPELLLPYISVADRETDKPCKDE